MKGRDNLERAIELMTISFWPILKAGLTITIPLAVSSFAIGLVIAIITAIARISKLKITKWFFSFYVWIFRGTPLLVQLFIVFYGLPKAGIKFDSWTAAILTFSLNIGAYASESIRGAVMSIPKGQWEAAESLGMTYQQMLLRIIAPQTIRIALPALANNFIGLVKETSLASSVTIIDMFMVGQQIAARTYEPLILYTEVAFIYLMFCTILTYIQGKLEINASKYVRK